MSNRQSIAGLTPKYRWNCSARALPWGFSLQILASMVIAVASHQAVADEAAEVYRGDRLLKINIQLSPDDWHALRISHRIADMARIAEDPYVYFKGDVEIDGVVFKSVGIRKKGFFGSVVSNRPSLKIRFDEWNEEQEFHGLDQLTLNNNIQDASQLNQYLAYWMFNRAGAIAPRCNFALVTVNGENLGIYSNVESIRDPFLDRAFNDSKGKLYEGYAGDLVDDEISFSKIVRKNGKPQSGRKTLERFRATLQDTSAGLNEIEKVVDVDAFLRFWAMEVLIGHWDSYSGNRNNYYLYQDSKSDRFYFIPWGADSVFQDPGPFILEPVPKSVKAVGAVCARLWQIPEVQNRFQKEMRRLLNTVWNEQDILAEMERIQTMLEPHIADKAAATIKSGAAKAFIANRRTEVLDELDGDTPEWPEIKNMIQESFIQPAMEITGTFRTTMSKDMPGNPFRSGKATLEAQIEGRKEKLTFAHVGSFAIPEIPDFIRPGYPAITLVAVDESKTRNWTLQFMIDPVRMKTEQPNLTVDHFCVWAMLIQGDPSSPKAARRVFGIHGTMKLDQFDPETGGTVAGSFRINSTAFAD